MTGEKPPALGDQSGIGILDEQLAESETGQGIVTRFGDGSPKPGNGLLAPSEECKAAAELVRGSHRWLFDRGSRRQERQGARVVVLGEPEPPMFERQGGRIRSSRSAQHPARLGDETRLAELPRQFQSGPVGRAPIKGQQFGQDLARLVVAAQHGEEPNAKRQVFWLTTGTLEHSDRCRIVEQSDVRLGPEPKQLRMGSVRASRVQHVQHRGEFLLFQETAGLGQDPRIRLDGTGHRQEQDGERKGHHGCRSTTLAACRQSHAAFDRRCIPAEPRRFASLCVAFRSKYTRASSPGGGSSLTRLVSRAPTGRTGPYRSRRTRHFIHRLSTAC